MSAAARPLLLAAALLAVAAPARAETARCPDVLLLDGENPISARVVDAAGGRVHFIEDGYTKGCPSVGKSCQKKSFVLPGDRVLTGEVEGEFACSMFLSARGVETIGFLPLKALREAPAATPGLRDWTGKWKRSAEAEITIRPIAGGRLEVSGEATWGARDPRRVASGAVNSGNLDGAAAPRGNMLALGKGYDGAAAPPAGEDFECRARLRLIGGLLIVEDNRNCGGANVSFIGVYRKVR